MRKKHILILNLLFETHFKTSFDQRIAEAFKNLDTPYDTIYLHELRNFDKFEHYTHLLISGSTECAAEENEWYPDLDGIIQRFSSAEKSILGICFGHQFIVRHLLGKEHVQKSSTAEIGWTEITHSNNPIFKNINSLKSAVFHYDEVLDLDNRFEITASSNRCAIHGFQLKGKPIWGVQFHPDFLYQDVFTFTEEVRKKNDQFDEIHCQTATSYDEFRVNDLVFKNWIEIS